MKQVQSSFLMILSSFLPLQSWFSCCDSSSQSPISLVISSLTCEASQMVFVALNWVRRYGFCSLPLLHRFHKRGYAEVSSLKVCTLCEICWEWRSKQWKKLLGCCPETRSELLACLRKYNLWIACPITNSHDRTSHCCVDQVWDLSGLRFCTSWPLPFSFL